MASDDVISMRKADYDVKDGRDRNENRWKTNGRPFVIDKIRVK